MKIGWRFKFKINGDEEEKVQTLYEENYTIAYNKLKEEFTNFTLIDCYRGDPERWLPIGIGEPAQERDKHLFTPNESWTDAAREIDRVAHGPLMSIIESYAGMGYKVREIAHVISGTLLSAECEAMLSRRANKPRG